MNRQSIKRFKQNAQAGFTLIELVVVIVILGILAATALPKFVDLSSDAYAAAAQGIAGGLSSANAVNVAGCAVNNSVVKTNVCVAITSCSQVGNLIAPVITFKSTKPDPTIAKGLYLVTDTAVTKGNTVSCAAVYGDGTTAGIAMAYSATGT